MNVVSRFFVLSLWVLLIIPTAANSQPATAAQSSIQCGYHFTRKDAPDKAPRKYLNMRLDYTDGVSMFYDLFTYERDSLWVLAFDENGKTKNQKEYDKILSLPRPRLGDITIVNFKKNEITQIYYQGPITVRATSEMSVPDWELSDESCTIEGFNCKKATADYLGRNWKVWYTEDVPLPAGPWMLWGAPGLIVSAHDSEEIFSFRLIWTDQLDNDGRIDFIDSRYPKKSIRKKGGSSHYVLSLKDAEQMCTRLRTDAAYFMEITGARTSSELLDRMQNNMKYIPLIPDAYWKGK